MNLVRPRRPNRADGGELHLRLVLVEPRRETTGAAETRRERFGGSALTALVLIAGLIVITAVYTQLRASQRENAELVMDQRTTVARAAVQTETERYRSLIEATAAGIATDERLTWEDFDAATAPLASAGLAGASSLAYVVPTGTAGIPATQRLWRERGAEGLVLKPAAQTGEHYFTVFSRLLNTAGQPLDGVDLASSPEATAALGNARRISQPAVSDTYVLLRDRNLPAAQQQHSFVFAAPLWTRAAEPAFRGWIVLGLRSQDFLTGVLATVGQGQLGGELLATGRGGDRPVVAHYDLPGSTDLQRNSEFPVADREWTLITRADSHQLTGAHSGLPLAVLLGGGAFTLMLAGLVWVLATGRTRARRQVRRATAELRAAEAESRRQAGLLGAVMASIGDGVGVVDESGAFLLHNPAAKALLGVGDDVGGPGEWQDHYGLFRPDGRTPFPYAELPLIRALNGESSDGVEMLVRNPGRPDGILVSVDGRPLDPSAGQHGAVAVFHDITELRRYENDLAIFAGVVAHDLKAPLTIIRGHCEMTTDHLVDAGNHPDVVGARETLVRIVRAVDRMAGLIDTLLAYATTRDAPLRFRPIGLAALVAEVVYDRIAHLRPAELPEITVGALPEVLADPDMLRHVLDNLAGNALKYVRPGSTARLDITGETAGGWVRIEFADRGIGIPDRDKPDVFESFHRAHASAGYAGTGLGLAICKRIVERHGGEIGVADNPGGGTRFTFTLPTSVRPQAVHPEEENRMPDTDAAAEEAARTALERALAERAAIQDAQLPGLLLGPSDEPETPLDRPRPAMPEHQWTGANTD
jgi:signal transduction histidine kinase